MIANSYQKQLADPRWQKKRLEIFQRDNFTCNGCHSSKKELHLHHKYYLSGKQAWEYPDDCYETLCFSCHEFEEETLKYELNRLPQILRESGFKAMDIHDFNHLVKVRALTKYSIDKMVYLMFMRDTLKSYGYDLDEMIKEKLIPHGYDFD